MPKQTAPKKPNPWIAHLKSVRVKNPKLSLKEAMQVAKTSYSSKG